MEKWKYNNQDLDRIRRICKEAGIRLTHQRLEIYKELMSATDNLSAEEVHNRRWRGCQRYSATDAVSTGYIHKTQPTKIKWKGGQL